MVTDSLQAIPASRIVNDVVQKLIGYLDGTIEFAKEQAPDLARQILIYEAWRYTFYCIVGAVVLLCGLVCLVCLIRSVKSPIYVKEGYHREWTEWQGFRVTLSVIGGVAGVVSVFTLFHNMQVLMMIHTAPKAYLLLYLKGLLS